MEIPDKLFFKIGEVSSITKLEPHILRYWETEFPSLRPRKNDSGQRLYVKRDVELVLKIKKLLYEDGYTIQGAKKELSRKNKKKENKKDPDSSQNKELQQSLDFGKIDFCKACDETKKELQGVLSILSR